MKSQEFKNLMRGPVVVVFTPFTEDATAVNEEQLRKNTRYIIDGGVKNGSGVLIPGGSTGDCYVMSIEERKKVMKIVVEEAKGEVPVVCGANHSSTNIVIELSKYAESIGAKGVMVTPPYYWTTPSDEAIYEHYKAINDNINIGIMIYNNVNIVNKDLSIELLEKLVKLDNILALKECTPNYIKYKRVVELFGDKVAVINGAGEWTEPSSYRLGTKAYISGFANFAPRLCVDIHQECIKENYKKANELIDKFKPLQNICYDYVSEVGAAQEGAMYKEISNILGFSLGALRLPILPVPEMYKEKLKKALEKNNFK